MDNVIDYTRLIIDLLITTNVPAWIPVLTLPILRFLELRFNIFGSKKIVK